MRVCEKLIGFADQNGGWTEEECQAGVFYTQELEKEVMPYCRKQNQSTV